MAYFVFPLGHDYHGPLPGVQHPRRQSTLRNVAFHHGALHHDPRFSSEMVKQAVDMKAAVLPQHVDALRVAQSRPYLKMPFASPPDRIRR